MKALLMSLVLVLAVCAPASALEPDELLVVYNASFEGSKELAEYYVAKRAVPKENVLALRAERGETVERNAYLETVQAPIKAWLDQGERQKKIRCLLLMRGVPSTVNDYNDVAAVTARDRANVAMTTARVEKENLEAQKTRLEGETRTDRVRAAELRVKIAEVNEKIAEAEPRFKSLKEAYDRAYKAWEDSRAGTAAAVDSELAAMYYPGDRFKWWLPNLLNYRTWAAEGREKLPKTFMVCRLDGPTDALVKRIIDDSVAVEARGLEGVAYFDTTGKHPEPEKKDMFAEYDDLMRGAAAMVRKTGMKVVVDERLEVFAPGSCPDAALYCGWGSLAKYVPAFRWVRGSVGWHVQSFEAQTLRDPAGTVWCKRMIEEGVAATYGPVREPFLTGFPAPAPFLAFLLTGRYTVAEAYWYTTPMTSWTLTLIADPLYMPFKRNPKMTVAQLREIIEPAPTPPAGTPKN